MPTSAVLQRKNLYPFLFTLLLDARNLFRPKKKKGTDLGMPLNPLPLTTVVDKRKLYCSSLPDIGHSGGALLEESNLINISDGNIHWILYQVMILPHSKKSHTGKWSSWHRENVKKKVCTPPMKKKRWTISTGCPVIIILALVSNSLHLTNPLPRLSQIDCQPLDPFQLS